MTSTTGPRASRASAGGGDSAVYDPGDGYSVPPHPPLNPQPTNASWSDDDEVATHHSSANAGGPGSNARFAPGPANPAAMGVPPPGAPTFTNPLPFGPGAGGMPPFATGAAPSMAPPMGSGPFGGPQQQPQRAATFAPSDASATNSAPLYMSDPEDASHERHRRRRRRSSAAADRGGYDDNGRDYGRDDERDYGRDDDDRGSWRVSNRDRDLDLDRGSTRRRSYAYGNDDGSSADEWNNSDASDGDRHRNRHRDLTRRSKSGGDGSGALQKRRRSLSRAASERISALLGGGRGAKDRGAGDLDDDDDRPPSRGGGGRTPGDDAGNSEMKKMAATIAGALVGGLAARKYRRDGGWVPAALGAVAGGLAAREGEKMYYSKRKGRREDGRGRREELPYEAAGRMSGERDRSRGR